MLNAIANTGRKKVSIYENACVASYSVFSHLNIDHKERLFPVFLGLIPHCLR